MTIEEKALERYIPDLSRLEAAGFTRVDGGWVLVREFMNGDFRAEITVSDGLKVSGRVYDTAEGSEYLPLRAENRVGAYVSHVRDAYSELLKEIASECFSVQPFASEQANRLVGLIKAEFGEDPDFPFTGKGNESSGIFRNAENRRWYAAVLRIARKKLEGLDGDDPVDVLDVKYPEDELPMLLNEEGIYPAYHMQKKFWVSVVLDDSLSDERIMGLIRISRSFTVGAGHIFDKIGMETVYDKWLIPANPAYYDIEGALEKSDVTDWSQSANIRVGDKVYMYVGVPVRAILWRFIAEKVDIPADYQDEHIRIKREMILRRDMTFDRTKTGIADMMRFGVKNVRGQRHMPPELAEYVDGCRID